MDILTLSHVSKSFGGRTVIDDLSFSVPEHSIFGFIGENGAGKTTTMKMILGLLRMDGGEIFVNGERVRFGQSPANRFIGYLPDVPEFYGFMTPAEYLRLCGKISRMPEAEIKSQTTKLLGLVGLDRADKKIQGFSRGMKQRLGIAQALLTKPKLLICDEPTSALDPAGRKEILDILSAAREHTTVIFSTHILTDVERICDEVALLHGGKIALRGSLSEIRALRSEPGFEIEFAGPEDSDRFSSAFPNAEKLSPLLLRCDSKNGPDILSAMKYLSENRVPVKRLEMLEPTLESLFMEVIGA